MLVSLIIVNYNYSRYLSSCIDSCLSQEFPENSYDVIIIDDGSTDGSQNVLLDHYSDNPRIKFYLRPNSGVESASNFGISKSTSDFILRVDSDDLLSPSYLKTIFSSDYLSYDMIYSDYYVINEKTETLERIFLPSFSPSEIKSRGDFLATATLLRRSLVLSLGLYDTSIKNCGLENYDLILRLLGHDCRGLHIPSPLFSYRRHSSNLSVTRRDSIIEYGRELAKLYSNEPYRTNQYHPYGLSF
tara:strand:- start:5316 stop:6047 length:732 start_codon:yes stop_codon:yes gene_type:complete